ncbi:MAG: sugar phosphate nucleotidyltransferase [Patescibacteria group bacterium]
MAYAVILCGGSGTRLWPMSRKDFPKQFLKLYGTQSLLQETYARVREFLPRERIFFVTNDNNAPHVLDQIRSIEKGFLAAQVIIEPAARNTAPAITLAMKYLSDNVRIHPDETVLFLPSDHYIGKREAYLACLQSALGAMEDYIGTIGIIPTKPETGYGYIRKGARKTKNSFFASAFKEKPDSVTAEQYVGSGEYLWNSGMYFFNGRTFFQELEAYVPEIAARCKESLEVFLEGYAELPCVSIDYALSEKSKRVVVFEGDFGWSDIGSFDSLADIAPHNPSARHVGIDSENVYTYSEENRLIATIGVRDLIVVESGGSILICQRGRSEDVKKMVEKLREDEHEKNFL